MIEVKVQERTVFFWVTVKGKEKSWNIKFSSSYESEFEADMVAKEVQARFKEMHDMDTHFAESVYKQNKELKRELVALRRKVTVLKKALSNERV